MPNRRTTGWRASLKRSMALVMILSAGGLLAASCAGDPPEVPVDDIGLVLGRDIYGDRCVNCHGANGQGGTGNRLNQGSVVEKYPNAEDQKALMRAGRNAMPSFSSLSDAELDAVVRYTREIINSQE